MPQTGDTENSITFYKKLLDESPDLIGITVFDNGMFTNIYCSEAVRDIYEMTPDQYKHNQQMFLNDRLYAADREKFVKQILRAKEKLSRYDFEFRVQLPKKGLRWLRLTGRPEVNDDGTLSFYSRVIDITGSKHHEEKLQASINRFEFALKAAAEGLWDWDIIANTIYFSGQSMKIIGLPDKAAVLGYDFWEDRIHPDDLVPRQSARNRGLSNKNSTYESIYRVRTQDGRYRWLLSRGKVIKYDSEGRAVRAVGIHKDITQLKEKEIQLGNTINIIGDQNNRLSNFAHIVSHNLRSHASNLKMLLDLFKNADEDEKEEMLQHLEGISDGLNITISHLKELVEIQTEVKNVKEDLNLRTYLKNILTILHNEITKHSVVVEINIPLDITVNYNAAYLESILLNFTTNAIKYSSAERTPVIGYDFGIENGQKVLSITDNGLGIDLKRHKNALFGMYKTFHKNKNSRGIGLFITKNQVEAMGGNIEVSSEVNKGTTFKIYFNE
jgi:PAS domain S-box-containing protein